MLNYEEICKILPNEQVIIGAVAKGLLDVLYTWFLPDSYEWSKCYLYIAFNSSFCFATYHYTVSLISERSFDQGGTKDKNLSELVASSMCLQYKRIIATANPESKICTIFLHFNDWLLHY